MINAFWLLWAIPCGIANRIRGGWFQDQIRAIFPFWSTTVARLFFSGVVSIPIAITHNWRVSIPFFLLFYVGLVFRWSPWQYMTDPKRDIPLLSLRGLIITLIPGALIHSVPFAICGASMGVVYWLSYQVPWKHYDGDYLWIGSDWGELFFGAVIGLFVGISILLG